MAICGCLLVSTAMAQVNERGPVQAVDGPREGDACGVDTLLHIVNGEDQAAMGAQFCCDLTSALYEPCGFPITARSFGAKGDGATDDSVAIQAAIDAGFHHLGPGTFAVDTTLVLGPGEGLTGDGPDVTTVKAITGLVGSVIEDLGVGASDGLFVHNLKVDCNAGIGVDGIQFQEDTNVRLSDLWVHDCDRAGIFLRDDTPLVADGLGQGAYIEDVRITDCLQTAAAVPEGAFWVQGWDRVVATNFQIDGKDLALADAGRRVGLLVEGSSFNSFTNFDVGEHETGVAIQVHTGAVPDLISSHNEFQGGRTHDNKATGFLVSGTTTTPDLASNAHNHFADCTSYHDGQSADGQWCGFEIGGTNGALVNCSSVSGGDAKYSSGFHFFNNLRQHDPIAYVYGLRSGGLLQSPCDSDPVHVLEQTGPDRCARFRHHDSFRAGEVNDGDINNVNIWGHLLDNAGDVQFPGNAFYKFGRNIDEDIILSASFDNGTSENSSNVMLLYDFSDARAEVVKDFALQARCQGPVDCRPAVIDRASAQHTVDPDNTFWIDPDLTPECAGVFLDASTDVGGWVELACGSDFLDPFD